MIIGVIGYGPFGTLLSNLLAADVGNLSVRVVNRMDESYTRTLEDCDVNNLKLYMPEDILQFSEGLDVIILAVSIASLEEVLTVNPSKIFHNKLIVDVCSVKVLCDGMACHGM